MKYWSKARIQRVRARKAREEQRALERYLESEKKLRTYSKGGIRKNAKLMLDALGSARHRRMLARLRKGGAMSVSHLVKPFDMLLSRAMVHIGILERAGLISTHKRGRIRFCVYNTLAAKELGGWLQKADPFDLD